MCIYLLDLILGEEVEVSGNIFPDLESVVVGIVDNE